MITDGIEKRVSRMWHVAIHAAAARCVHWVMSVCNTVRFRLQIFMTLQAGGVILIWSQLPFWSDTCVWIMAVDAAELRVAAALHRVGKLCRVPCRHAPCVVRP